MEYGILVVLMLLILIVLKWILGVRLKELKEFLKIERLDKIAEKFPDNISICKTFLKKLHKEDVKIVENNNTDTSLYNVVGNTITIAAIQTNYARVQTIAHECIHSVQKKKVTLCNFIVSNIYLFYFIICVILTLVGILKPSMMQLVVLLLIGLIYYIIRSYLETDAMTKARYLAEEYMTENNYVTKEEAQELLNKYDQLNTIGIPFVNYQLLFTVLSRTILYGITCLGILFFKG